MFTAVALTGSPPFKTVITTGWTLDEERQKESKSKGNITSPLEMIEKHGADVLRLWVSSVDYSVDMVLGGSVFGQTADAYRKIRNTLRFLLGNISDFDEQSDSIALDEMTEIDRWALSRTQSLLEAVTDAFDRFAFYRAYRLIYTFCTVDLSSFYLDILKDRLYTFGPSSRERRSSQTAFSEIARLLDLILAPILAFTADEVWQRIRREDDPPSVHLAAWPQHDPSVRDRQLEQKWEKLQLIRAEVAKAIEGKRDQGEIGNSLQARITLYCRDAETQALLSNFGGNLKTYFIVSSVDVVKVDDGAIPEKAMSSGIDNLLVAVDRAPGRKCTRCWKYSSSVGQSVQHPEICEDCIGVLTTFFGEGGPDEAS